MDAADADELTTQVVEEDYRRRWYGAAPLQPWASKQDAGRDPVMLGRRWWGVGAERQELHVRGTTLA